MLDLGSTKTQIVERMQALPDVLTRWAVTRCAVRSAAGWQTPSRSCTSSAPFALTPLARTSPRLQRWLNNWCSLVGAHPLWLDAETHDRWVAATSHVPYLVANALAAATPLEARPLVGPGLRSTTRLAPSGWTMMQDILETNRPNILAGLQEFPASRSKSWKAACSRRSARARAAGGPGRARAMKRSSID